MEKDRDSERGTDTASARVKEKKSDRSNRQIKKPQRWFTDAKTGLAVNIFLFLLNVSDRRSLIRSVFVC